MRALITLVRRELSSHFLSWSGYVVVAAVLFLIGLSFTNMITAMNGTNSEMQLTEIFYNTQYFWLILLLASPVITMRTFALEKASGTYETLMTTPVGDLTVVLAKYIGALIFFMLMWLPLLLCLFVLRHYSTDPTALDPRVTAVTFLGIMLIGSVYMAMGCWASALTSSQVVAAMVSLGLGVALFIVGFLSYSNPTPTTVSGRVLEYVSIISHLKEFARGVVDSRPLTFYATLTGFFLFLTLKAVESRRWK